MRSLGVQKQNRKHVYQQTYGSLTIFDRGIAKCSGLAPRCKIGTIPIKKFRSSTSTFANTKYVFEINSTILFIESIYYGPFTN